MSPYTGPAQAAIPEPRLSVVPEDCRPRALGAVPRLGLGSRTTTLGWPTIYRFLSSEGIYANAIQNSVARELMPLDMLDDHTARPTTFLPGLGPVPVGHTGSTIEGLLDWGTLSAAEAGYTGPGFGADADHLPVYDPNSESWAQTLRLIHHSRGYTHFTLDVGAVVDWGRGPIDRLARVPRAIAAAAQSIAAARDGRPFDVEISLDESPETVSPDSAASTPAETNWLLEELAAADVTVHYVAPHLGFTKGCDAADRGALAIRSRELCRAAEDHSALLSIHSGDHLSRTTRRVLGEACGGKLLFKVSPALQDILVGALLEQGDDAAERLRCWTLDYAAQCGCAAGSEEEILHKHAFAAFGARSQSGAFEMRELLYSAAEAVRDKFEKNLAQYLRGLRDDLMI